MDEKWTFNLSGEVSLKYIINAMSFEQNKWGEDQREENHNGSEII